MKKLFYLIAIGAIVLASCTKPEEKPEPNNNDEPTYSFSIGAEKEPSETDETDETRVQMVNDVLHWAVGDKVGLHANAVGQTTSLLNQKVLTGRHTTPTRSTTFDGEITQSEILKFSPSGRYNYITYYPHTSDAAYAASRNQIAFVIPEVMTITKNKFPSEHVLMYASAINVPPISYLDGNGIKRYGEKRTFTYKHAYAYLRLKIEDNLSPQNITKIEMSTGSYSITDASLSGYIYVDVTNGAITRSGTSGLFRRTIEIPGGLNVGDEVYIPMPATTYRGGSIRFTFTYSNGDTYETNIPASTSQPLTLESGKIYPIRFKLPFIADFRLNYYAFYPSTIDENTQSFDFMGDPYLSYRVLFDKTKRAILFDSRTYKPVGFATPALNLGGKTSLQVLVKVTASRPFTGQGSPSSANDRFYVKAVPTSETTYTATSSGTSVVPIYVSESLLVSGLINLTTANRRIGIDFTSRYVGNPFLGRTQMELYRLEIHPQ